MTLIHIQWADSTKSSIASVFSCPQDDAAWKDQDTIPSDDARYAEYFKSMPTSVQAMLITPGE